jgi:hypothetical protein
MSTLGIEIEIPRAIDVVITEDTLTVELSDGRLFQFLYNGFLV